MKSIKLLVLSTLILSCQRNEIIYFYSVDKSQCVTVINKGEYRYIINGEWSKIPDSNYVKLRVDNIDPLQDAIYICWRDKDYEWKVVGRHATIAESTLDTSLFNFNTELPIDVFGLPSQQKFANANCAIFDFYSMKLTPNRGAIVQIK